MTERANAIDATTGDEWVLGLVSLPEYVQTDEGPIRRDALIRVAPDGAITTLSTSDPGELLRCVGDVVRLAVATRPRGPARIRVGTPLLAALLRGCLPTGVAIEHAPTPEIDAALEAMHARAEMRLRERRSYFANDTFAPAIAALFGAVRALHEARPWDWMPGGDALLSFTIEALDVVDALVAFEPGHGRAPNMLQFVDRRSFDARPRARHLALHFVSRDALSTRQRAEIRRHAWPVAADDACPQLDFVDEDGVVASPSPEEQLVVEAIARATAMLASARERLLDAWRGGPPFEETLLVATHAGPVVVEARAPYEADRARAIEVRRLVCAMRSTDASAQADAEAGSDLDESLMLHFVDAHETEVADEWVSVRRAMELARERFGRALVELAPWQLREIVLDVLPRDRTASGGSADDHARGAQAFFRFLARMGVDRALALLGALEAPRAEASNALAP